MVQPGRLGLGAGVVGALAGPVTGVGIGWLVVAVALFAVAIAAGPAPVPTPDRGWRVAAGAAGLALVAVAAFRSAGWLVALCLLAAAPLGSYALTGGRSGAELLRSGFAVLPAAWRGLRPGADRVGSAPMPEPVDRPAWLGRGLAGLVIGVLLLLVFGALLSGSDPAFAALLRSWGTGFSVGSVVRAGFGFGLAGVAAVGIGTLRREAPAAPAPRPDWDPVAVGLPVWLIPLVMLDALFGVFVWVQVTTLFAGKSYVLGPDGPDYAVYARGGSAQLGVVAGLTLLLFGAVAAWVRPVSTVERLFLRGFGGVLCGLSLVIVGSALDRLGLYVGAYGFTLPRLLGYAGIVFIGAVFVLLLVAGIRLRAAWFTRAVVAVAVAVLLALAAVNPEALMARTHLDRLTQEYPIDQRFLAGLSADAVDALDRLPEPVRSCVLDRLAGDLAQPDPWYRWNAARAHARALLAAHPADRVCFWRKWTQPPV